MLWKELVKLALLGTERSNLSPTMVAALQSYGIDTSKEITEVVLEGAAIQAPLQKVGFEPKEWENQLLPVSPEETLINCSTQSANHLSLILSGQYAPTLVEFIQTMVAHHKCLPYEVLPELLDKCVKDEWLWEQLQGTIGNRGNWLIDLNPNWQSLRVIVSEEKWETGTRAERVAILKKLRKDNPVEGLRLLLSTWAEDGLQEKIAFLKCLFIGLSDLDEAFLESCLDFSRKEVRETAAYLLSLLPNSPLQKRLFAQLKIAVTVEEEDDGTEKPVIILPKTSDKTLARDGINPKKKWKKGQGSTGILYQMVALIPPEKWEAHLQKTPEEIVLFFAKSEWSELLIEALVAAAILHQSPTWKKVLLLFWLDNYTKKRWAQLNVKPILDVLPNEVFNAVVFQKLKAAQRLPEEHSPLIQLLQKEGYVWDDKLTKLVMNQLKEWIQNNASYSWSGFQYRNLLKRAAYNIRPEIAENLTQFWMGGNAAWAGWEKDLRHFLTALSFRKKMLKELESI